MFPEDDDPSPGMQTRLTMSGNRVVAASGVQEAKLQEFMSSLMVGSEPHRRWHRDAVMAATEALLDAHEDNAIHILRAQGVDPDKRHKR